MDYTPGIEDEIHELQGKRLGIFPTIAQAKAKQCQHALSRIALERVN
jgi:hypothetical protein